VHLSISVQMLIEKLGTSCQVAFLVCSPYCESAASESTCVSMEKAAQRLWQDGQWSSTALALSGVQVDSWWDLDDEEAS